MGTLKLNTTSGGSLSIQAADGASDNTLTLPAVTGGNIVTTGDSGTVTQGMIGSGVAGNGPAFAAYQSSSQSITSGAYYKTNFQSEFFDTDSCYDTTNSRFLPTVAGYYSVSATIMSTGPTGHHNGFAVNGTIVRYGANISNLSTYGICNTTIIYLNGSTDYVEYYTLFSGNQTINAGGSANSWFCGHLVRAA
jgi:hypothetical protein